MYSAYLEDFNDIKLIIDSGIMIDKENLYALFDNEKIKLYIEKEEYWGNKVHYYLKSEKELEPYKDIKLLVNPNLNVYVSLGKITRSKLFDKKYYFKDWLGFKYFKEYTIFRIWTPVSKEVRIVLKNKKFNLEYTKKGVWEIKIDGDLDKTPYYYEIRINDKFIKTVDPYAVSSNADHKVNYVVDLNKTYQMKYSYYENDNFSYNKTFIYELSVRDATSLIKHEFKGTYDALRESSDKDYGLGHIKNLGITHVQLLPIYAFGGVKEEVKDCESPDFMYNWGYNPMQYMVPSGFFAKDANDPYSRINELKELIDEIHSLNLGVNMDVVFNHVYDSKWYPMEKLVPGYTFRTDDRGYLTNSSWCGNDLNTNHLMIRKLIVDSVLYFQKFYMIDGFRFDLMGLIDIDTMKEVKKETDKNNNMSMIYGEGWNMDVLLPQASRASMNNAKKMPNIAFFNDYFRNKLKEEYLLGNSLNNIEILNLLKGYFYGGGKFLSSNQSINYLECHDNYTLHDNFIVKNGNYSQENINDYTCLGLGLNVLANGITFIHAGMEKGRTKKLIDNSYNLGDNVNGINWYPQFDYTNTLKDLIDIKKKYSLFTIDKVEEIDNSMSIDKYSDILTIRYKYKDKILQMLISNNYKKYSKFFAPGTKLIFDGKNKTNKEVEAFEVSKPGVYLFEK